MKKYLLILMAFCLFAVQNGHTQDIHFSQFYANPLSFNPAETGHFDSDWRISNIYRNQWKSIAGIPYKTLSIGFDKKQPIMGEKFSWGIYLVHDQSGPATLTANKVYASLAYHKTIDGNRLWFGIQPGFSLKSISTGSLTFPSQWDRHMGDFNTDLYHNEPNLGENLNYFDVNAGVLWSRDFGNFVPEVGISVFHLNYPKETFSGGNEHMSLRKVFHFGTTLDLNKSFFLMPRFLYMSQRRASDMILGSNIGYRLPQNGIKAKSIFGGLYFRSGFGRNVDAFYYVVGMNFKTFDIGFSYDINVSGLKTATNGKGAFEISFIYKAAIAILKQIDIPCDRF